MRCLLGILLVISLLFGESGISEFDRENNRIFELFADSVESEAYKIVIAKGNANFGKLRYLHYGRFHQIQYTN